MLTRISLAIAVVALGLLTWIGYELHQVNRRMPTGTDYDTEQRLRSIAMDVEQMNKTLIVMEKNARR